MFADVVALRTMLIAPNSNPTVTSYADYESYDPYYASQGFVSKWTDGSYATNCSDYDTLACHNGPYLG